MPTLGEWYNRFIGGRRALKAWNNGTPLLSLDTAKQASLHYAQHWVRWAGELKMAEPHQYSPVSTRLSSIVSKPFWTALMQAHGLREAPQRYWTPLLYKASMEGNLSAIEAFAEVFGLSMAVKEIEELALVHPRVVGWQAANGLLNKKHVRTLIDMNWLKPGYSGWDAQEFVQGGPVMLAWILDWVKLPDTIINEEDGYAFVRYISGLLDEMEAEPGERAADGMTTLKNGHQFRKHRVWAEVSDLATPIIAGPTLIMLRTLYKRFGFDHLLMDAVAGRWTSVDLHDARVCAIVHYINNTAGTREGLSWREYRDLSQGEGLVWGKEIEAKADPVIFQMLQLQANGGQSFSVYQSAIPFFRSAAEKLDSAEQFEVGSLLMN